MARPSDLTTKSFLGITAYFIGNSLLYQFFCWALYDSDLNTCVTPTKFDANGQPEYAAGCGIFQFLALPLSLYTLFVIVVSYRQQPYQSNAAATQQPAQQQVQQIPMQQIQTPVQPVDNPVSMAMYQQPVQQPVQQPAVNIYQQQPVQQPAANIIHQQHPGGTMIAAGGMAAAGSAPPAPAPAPVCAPASAPASVYAPAPAPTTGAAYGQAGFQVDDYTL